MTCIVSLLTLPIFNQNHHPGPILTLSFPYNRCKLCMTWFFSSPPTPLQLFALPLMQPCHFNHAILSEFDVGATAVNDVVMIDTLDSHTCICSCSSSVSSSWIQLLTASLKGYYENQSKIVRCRRS